jgi:carbon storage regulator
MLVLSRKEDEVILIDGGIRLRVVSIRGGRVKLGITAPPAVKILREELAEEDDGRGANGALERASGDPTT